MFVGVLVEVAMFHILFNDVAIILSMLCITPGRRQSKMLSTIYERGSKIDRNRVFDCHLSPVWRQMAIKNSVSNHF